jgi:hypothetical protein
VASGDDDVSKKALYCFGILLRSYDVHDWLAPRSLVVPVVFTISQTSALLVWKRNKGDIVLDI